MTNLLTFCRDVDFPDFGFVVQASYCSYYFYDTNDFNFLYFYTSILTHDGKDIFCTLVPPQTMGGFRRETLWGWAITLKAIVENESFKVILK